MSATDAIFDASNPSSPISIPAAETAVLLMDFHAFLIESMPPEGRRAVETAASLRDWAHTQGMTVVHCLIDTRGPTAPQLKMAARANQLRKSLPADPTQFRAAVGTTADLTPSPDEYVFWRPLGRISGLSSYGLSDFIARRGIRSLIIAGVATSGCVIDTAKAATETDLIVSVVEDACADRTVEVHEFVARQLLVRQCHVATFEELSKAWK